MIATSVAVSCWQRQYAVTPPAVLTAAVVALKLMSHAVALVVSVPVMTRGCVPRLTNAVAVDASTVSDAVGETLGPVRSLELEHAAPNARMQRTSRGLASLEAKSRMNGSESC